MDYFYPTDVLVTGYDIIFFWVIRMVFSAFAHTGKSPFHTVFIHGLVRDSQGRKMSKSLGNGIDPLEVIEQYGADALRMTLVTGNAPGNDMRFYDERVEANRNFANKVWNASRFILMNMEDKTITTPDLGELTPTDKWILSKVNTLAKDVTENMDKFELGIALQKVYDFIWDEFCDWYIELAKYRMYHADEDAKAANATLWTLKTVLANGLKLLHPFMPFVSEEIYSALAPLMNASEIVIQSDKEGIAEDAVSVVVTDAVVYLPLAELVDFEQEIERLKKEEAKLEKELARVNGMLGNEKFISKAPEAKINEEKAKLEKYTQMMEQVKERLAGLQK